MAIKAGQILHDARGFVVDRIQTGGVSNLNIPETKIYELGNYQTVATVRDIPDLSFDLESFDVSCEIEALINNVDPSSIVAGQEFDFIDSVPLDITSPFKSAQGQFNIVNGLAIPYLTLESALYRFGLKQDATQHYTLRGDAVYYIPGSPYYKSFAGTGGNGPFSFDHTATVYNESGSSIYALSVCVHYADGTYKRLFHGSDYTDSSSALTLTAGATDAPVGSTIQVLYGSTTAASYPQSKHQGVSVKPAAVRGKDIDVYIGTNDATPVFSRWTGVQSFEVTRKVNLSPDEEFGNKHYVGQDYDTADVTGSIGIKSVSVADLFAKITQVAGVPANEIVGPLTSDPFPVELRVNDPSTGSRMKTLYIPDARFTVPGIQGKVQTKQEVSFTFASDTGTLLVYNGVRP